jgi:hypothetical protein
MTPLFWKTYFWLITMIDILSFVWPQERRIYETVDSGFILLAFIGLFGFAWSRQLFNRLFWQLFLIFMVLWFLVYLFFIPPVTSVINQAASIKMPLFVMGILAMLPHVPLLIALYFYAFGDKAIWKREETSVVL